jgi:hypothetical protein
MSRSMLTLSRKINPLNGGVLASNEESIEIKRISETEKVAGVALMVRMDYRERLQRSRGPDLEKKY